MGNTPRRGPAADTAPVNETAEEPTAAAPEAPKVSTIVFADGVATLDGCTCVSYDADAKTPKGVEHLVVGRDLQQIGFASLAEDPGQVCVGPAHAAYVAINVAYQRGARAITVEGVPPDTAPTEGDEQTPADPGSQLRARMLAFLGKAPVAITFA